MDYISKKNILFFLVIIATISLGFKLYTVDFTVLPGEDVFGWVLLGISNSDGDFTEHPRKTLGWPIFLAPFFNLIDSNDFLDYVNVARTLGLILSTITVIPMYLLSRKFFDVKYSLCATGLFAFEPHLNYVAGQGMTEPIYILAIIISLYFMLQKNSNYSYLSFLTIGLLWWIRWQGIIMLLVASIIFFRNYKKTPKLFLKYFTCLAICMIVVSPMLVERYDQFGDPLYFSQSLRLFTGEYASILGENMLDFEYSAFDYIDNHGFGKFIENFVLMGIYNLFSVLFKMSFPYLIIFLPFGIIFSLRAFDQEKKYIQANWVLILITLVPFVLYFAILPEKRLIYHVYPFLVILAIIPLQRLVEYGLSTFSYNDRQKKIILTGILGAVLLSSCFYTLRYDLPDPVLNDEKILFADILSKQFEGKILDAGNTLQGLTYVNITNPPGIFKNYEQTEDYVIQYTMGFNKKNINLMPTTLYAKSLEDFIKVSYEYELKYISINKNGVEDVFYPYLDEIYENEEKFPYLIKIFDTEQEGFEKLKVKVFEIDYKKFYQLNN